MSSSDQLLQLVQSKLGNQILRSETRFGDVTVWIAPESVRDCFQLLKLDTELGFEVLVDVTVTDWLDSRENRFEVVYHLLSTSKRYRLRVKVEVPEESPEVESVTALWASANFMEREVWDMYGVVFKGHPDPRRILLYDEFEGHPLRKDYPVQAKQPRIPLRHPEVRNTAVDMRRPELVQIRGRKEDSVQP